MGNLWTCFSKLAAKLLQPSRWTQKCPLRLSNVSYCNLTLTQGCWDQGSVWVMPFVTRFLALLISALWSLLISMPALFTWITRWIKQASTRTVVMCFSFNKPNHAGWLLKHMKGHWWHHNIHCPCRCHSHCSGALWKPNVWAPAAPNWYKSILVARLRGSVCVHICVWPIWK